MQDSGYWAGTADNCVLLIFFPLFHSTRVNSLLCWWTELAKAHGLEGKNLDLIKYPPSIASSVFSNEEITSQPYGRHPVMLLPAVPVIASSIKEFLCKDPHCPFTFGVRLRAATLQPPPCRCNQAGLLFVMWDTDNNTSVAAENSGTDSKSCWEGG